MSGPLEPTMKLCLSLPDHLAAGLHLQGLARQPVIRLWIEALVSDPLASSLLSLSKGCLGCGFPCAGCQMCEMKYLKGL